MNHKSNLKIALLTISSMFSIVAPAFASGVGEKIGGSLTTNIQALIPGILLAVGIYFLITRDWMKMISFVAIGVILGIFTNWTWVTGIGKKIYESFIQ